MFILTNGAEEATSTEIQNKQDELDHARTRLEWEESKRKWLNDRHSQAGDDSDHELERDLGEELEKKDDQLDTIRELIKELVEWFAN